VIPWRTFTTTLNTNTEQDPRLNIIETAVRDFVKLHGWTVESLSLAAEKHGYPGVAHGMFPDGAIDLVEYFIQNCNKEMSKKILPQDMESMTMKDRIKLVIRTRLEMVAPFKNNWFQALGLLALPQNGPRSLHSLAVLVDEILFLAGDKSSNFDWYTKRALISAIYISTELFMLTDMSSNLDNTWQFLERRMEDLVTSMKYKTELENTAVFLGNGIYSVLKGAFPK